MGQRKEAASAGPAVAAPSEPARRPEPAARPGNLPKLRSALFGRDNELSQLRVLLSEASLVTVTGAGGVGKTRIVLDAGHTLAADFEDGVWLAELAPVADPGQVPGAVARAMNIELPAAEDPETALVDRLRLRRCLIILDNCEHVIDAAAGLAEAVLDATEGVKLLASSQEPLGVEGEHVFRLRSLREADGAALFKNPNGPARPSRGSRSPSTKPARLQLSAGGSTAFRWPSRWPLRARRHWAATACCGGSTTASGC